MEGGLLGLRPLARGFGCCWPIRAPTLFVARVLNPGLMIDTGNTDIRSFLKPTVIRDFVKVVFHRSFLPVVYR